MPKFLLSETMQVKAAVVRNGGGKWARTDLRGSGLDVLARPDELVEGLLPVRRDRAQLHGVDGHRQPGGLQVEEDQLAVLEGRGGEGERAHVFDADAAGKGEAAVASTQRQWLK